MNKLELIDKRKSLKNEIEKLVDTVKIEVRKMNEAEETRFSEIDNEIRDIDNELNKPIKKEIKMKNYRLLNVIREQAEKRTFSDESIELIEAGKRAMQDAGQSYEGTPIPFEFRADLTAGSATTGAEVIAEDKMNIIEPLRDSLVLVQAGAEFVSGLVGNVSMPTYSGSSVLWKGETASAVDGAGSFGEIEMKPKRLTAKIEISKQLLIQNSQSVEEMLKRDIVRALAGKLEATILGNGKDVTEQPNGILGGITATSNEPVVKGAASFGNVVALETAVDAGNGLADNLVYITNAKGRGILKTSSKGTTGDLKICEGGEVNGYKLLVSNAVPSVTLAAGAEQPLVFGNFSDMIIGQWGALDIVVDPYTKAADGKIVLVINAYFDAVKRRSASFAVGSIK
jgi:HK97 family phage major capsid protein